VQSQHANKAASRQNNKPTNQRIQSSSKRTDALKPRQHQRDEFRRQLELSCLKTISAKNNITTQNANYKHKSHIPQPRPTSSK
jgi:hypothetical protein